MSTHAITAAATATTRLRRGYTAGGILAAGAAASATTVLTVPQSPVLLGAETTGILRGLFVAAWVAAGTHIWWHRPERRLGPLVAATGFFYAATSLNASRDELAYTLGRVVLAAFAVYLMYVFLGFPRDRLAGVLERRLVTTFAVATVALWLPLLVVADSLPPGGALAQCGSRCPGNALQLVSTSHAVSRILAVAVGVATAAWGIALALVLTRKARSPFRLRRRAVEPLLYAFVTLIAVYIAASLSTPADETLTGLQIASGASAVAIPLAMIVGQARTRSYAAETLARLVAQVRGQRVTPTRAQSLLRDAIGDPTLALALWDRERLQYVDVEGELVDVQATRPERELTPVTHAERPVAVVIHAPWLDEATGVLEGLAQTSLMLLENTWLVDELRASRARIVDATDRERRRLERDLHDGAQQRLILLQIKLARAQRRLDRGWLSAELEQIGDDAAAALEELRVLAHGIYPTTLRETGLTEALRAHAAETRVPVRVVDGGIGRCSPTVEAAVYFCALEAIQNAVKHAGPDPRLTVELDRHGDEIEFSIADHGIGFKDGSPRDGIGLDTMRDRIGAVGGELEIISTAGVGVTVRGRIADAPRLDHEVSERA
jgi:signal transduction histidine kinase